MSNQIFQRDKPVNKHDPVYHKVGYNYNSKNIYYPELGKPNMPYQNNEIDDIEEDDIVIGEPVEGESERDFLNEKNLQGGNYFGNYNNQYNNPNRKY